MRQGVIGPFAKKIDEVFNGNGWKVGHLAPAVSASVVQKIRKQNYVPTEKTVGVITEALKASGVPADYKELLGLLEKQKILVAGFQRQSSLQQWQEYLQNSPETQTALETYLLKYTDRYGYVKLLTMTEPMLLEELYTDVQMVDPSFLRKLKNVSDLEKEFRRSTSRDFLPKDSSRIDGLELANKTPFLNVLGQPGAGKSTFLRRIGLEALRRDKEKRFKHDCIPIYLELRRFKGPSVNLEDKIRQDLVLLGFPRDFLDTALKHGKLLILLDGLDEVPTADLDKAVENIREFVNNYSSNRFILSCRTAIYQTWFTRFTDVALADFEPEQIKSFLNSWFRSEIDRQCETAEKFWTLLSMPQNAATLELARRPLLLTFICLFYNDALSLPANRNDLFEQAFRILLEKWAAEKRLHNNPICRNLTNKWEIILLEQIAGPAFKKNRIFFNEQTLINEIDRILQNDLHAPNVEGKDVLDAIELQQGLLVKRAQNVYSFSHLSLQEYLAAQFFLHAGKSHQIVAECFFDKRWREVFLLITGGGLSDAILIQMANVIKDRIKAHPKLCGVLDWVDTNTRPPKFGPRYEERFVARRAATLFFALAFDNSSYKEKRTSLLESILDFAISIDPALNLNRFTGIQALTSLTDDKIANHTIFNYLKYLKKDALLKPGLIDEIEKRLRSLNFSKDVEEKVWEFVDDQSAPASEVKKQFYLSLNIPVEYSHWSKEEVDDLEEILYGCNFLLECKECSLSVNRATWNNIAKNLFHLDEIKSQ